MTKVNVDLINNGAGTGEVANVLQSNGQLNANAMRPYMGDNGQAYVTVFAGGDAKKPENYKATKVQTNATLRRDEWKQLDEAVLGISRYRLGGIDDLISRGLTYQLGNAMGTTVLEWHTVSDGMEADLTMDGVTRSKNDRPVYKYNYLPIPILHVDYEINARALAASRNMGNPLDVTDAEQATRRIREKLENMLFTNTTYSFGEKDSKTRNTIYSYINHPDRNTVTLSANWDASGKTSAQIVADVQNMKKALVSAKHFGPYVLYVPTDYDVTLDNDYDTTTPGTTTRERVLKLDKVESIMVSDSLPEDNVVLVQMTPDVVRLVQGMPLQNVQWGQEGNMITKYKVLTIAVPQIRSDQDGNSGIAHLA